MYPDTYKNKEDEEAVYFFSSPFDPLNNWSANVVNIWGKTFNSSEHAYQYKKYSDKNKSVADQIIMASSPWAAFQISRRYKDMCPPDWDEVKVDIMKEVLLAKLNQNEDVKDTLKRTGQRKIIENSPWDDFWGCGANGEGKNVLGSLWVEIRDGSIG